MVKKFFESYHDFASKVITGKQFHSYRGGVAKIKGPGKACRKGAHDSLKSLSEN